jgi:integrase
MLSARLFHYSQAPAGVDLRTVQELGGWADLTMVQRYAHLSPNHKANAVEKIAVPIPNAFHNTDILAVKDAACG